MEPMEIYNRAMDCFRENNYGAALAHFVELHEINLSRDDMHHALRRTFGLHAWCLLGRSYPMALEKLRHTLQEKEALIAAGSADDMIMADVAAIKRCLATTT